MVVMQPPIAPLTLDAVQACAAGIAARDGAALDRDQEWQLRLWGLQNEVDVVQTRAAGTLAASADAREVAKLAAVQALLRVAARAALWIQALEGGFPSVESGTAGPAAGGDDLA